MAATYQRISADREGRELGVTRQLSENRSLAEREGLALIGGEPYTDNDISASTSARKERPQYQRLLADARAGRIKVIVALTQGRLTRTPREYEDLIDLATKYGVRFLYVKSPSFDLNTAQGRGIGRTMAARAAEEAEETSERVLDAARQRAEKAEPHGHGRAYGLRKGGRALRPKEAAEIERWAAHVLAGGSLKAIADDLNERRIKSANGGIWRSANVGRILRAPRIAGLRLYQPPTPPGEDPPEPIEYPAAHPAIVPVATWRALRVILDDPKRLTNGGAVQLQFLGTGLYRCERCEGRTVASSRNRAKQRTYKCPGCWRTWKAEPIDEWIAGAGGIVELLLTKEDERQRLLPRPEKSAGAVDTAALEEERRVIGVNLGEVAAEFALAKSGAVRKALQDAIHKAEARLAEIDAAVVAAGRVDPLTEVLGDDPVAAWRAMRDVHRRQALIRRVMTITLGTPLRGRQPFDPKRFITVEPL
ncbi:recombinase family protein [Actinoplanes couchii]|nr:recombinase family protein [Actinoplanes couchii]MDR6316199.1 DNA invertase Pin-like site-specific DNA recombinase [Actinoplanes couchii]